MLTYSVNMEHMINAIDVMNQIHSKVEFYESRDYSNCHGTEPVPRLSVHLYKSKLFWNRFICTRDFYQL